MLLMSQYLQGTHRSTTTWNVHGLAVKAAFQLGLHHTASSNSHSVLEKEIRLRTWYGCVVLDRCVLWKNSCPLGSRGKENFLTGGAQDPEYDFWSPPFHTGVIYPDTLTETVR